MLQKKENRYKITYIGHLGEMDTIITANARANARRIFKRDMSPSCRITNIDLLK